MEPSGTFSAMCTTQLNNFVRYLDQNYPEIHHLNWNLPERHLPLHQNSPKCYDAYLHRNSPETSLQSAQEPSKTLCAVCARTKNLIGYLPQNSPLNSPELCQPSAPEPPELHQQSATEASGTLRDSPEPPLEPSVATAPDC